jgi:GTP cyclohydrolase I
MCNYEDALKARGEWREGTYESPARAKKALAEMTAGYDTDVADLFTLFDSPNNMPVICANIEFSSLCEHHLLPFLGSVSVAYTPNGKVVGLSKIGRVVEALSKRFQIQERLGQEIADAINCNVEASGCTVLIDAIHTCMCCRGVSKRAITRTIANAGDAYDLRLSLLLSTHKLATLTVS